MVHFQKKEVCIVARGYDKKTGLDFEVTFALLVK
jgi:hypothetical protein